MMTKAEKNQNIEVSEGNTLTLLKMLFKYVNWIWHFILDFKNFINSFENCWRFYSHSQFLKIQKDPYFSKLFKFFYHWISRIDPLKEDLFTIKEDSSEDSINLRDIMLQNLERYKAIKANEEAYLSRISELLAIIN